MACWLYRGELALKLNLVPILEGSAHSSGDFFSSFETSKGISLLRVCSVDYMSKAVLNLLVLRNDKKWLFELSICIEMKIINQTFEYTMSPVRHPITLKFPDNVREKHASV